MNQLLIIITSCIWRRLSLNKIYTNDLIRISNMLERTIMKCVYLFSAILILYSCTESEKDKITRLVKEWEGKEIVFPADLIYTKLGKDTVDYQMPINDFTILHYIDSVGCTSCKLHLTQWKEMMTQLSSICDLSIDFQFIFHPKNERELFYLLRRNHFDYPVCIDKKNRFKTLNSLPEEEAFHTFLLNKQNKVIAIGDPTQNSKIEELFLQIVKGEKTTAMSLPPTTQIEISPSVVDLGKFNWQKTQKAVFTLRNTGKNLLAVSKVISSCGCTSVNYSNEPVKPDDSIEIFISYKAYKPEYFNKAVMVYCNVENGPIALNVKGMAK